MGYTHYYGFRENVKTNEETANKFKMAVELFKTCLAALPKTYVSDVWNKETKSWEKKRLRKLLFNGIGEDKPIINDTTICFNGDARYDLDHETFRLALNAPGWDWEKRIEIPTDYPTQNDFCKTAQKPYDIAVCLCLLSFKEIFGDDFEVSSDGTMRENIINPSKYMKEYSEMNDYTYVVEWSWQDAYKVFDKVMGREGMYSLSYHA